MAQRNGGITEVNDDVTSRSHPKICIRMSKSAGVHVEPLFLILVQRYNKNKLEMCKSVQYCAVLNYFPNATLNGFMPRVPSWNLPNICVS